MNPVFRTVMPPMSYPFAIAHQDGLLSVGSCFTEHIGVRLSDFKFTNTLNPFGIIYNPISLANSLAYLVGESLFEHTDLFDYQGLWHSFAHHGRFSHPDRTQALAGMNASLHTARAALPSVNRLLLTLGTAHVFVHRESGQVVANCHKLPGSFFERRRLSPEAIVAALVTPLQQLKSKNADFQVIITVSPVRHLRDGHIENQRSKAALLLAADQLCQTFDFVHYFPAYELVLDDLRDYRFYASDMIHPDTVAVDYIWRYFSQAFFKEPTQHILRELDALQRACAHRPFHVQTSEHQAFARRQLHALEQLRTNFPWLNLDAEQALLAKQLNRSF